MTESLFTNWPAKNGREKTKNQRKFKLLGLRGGREDLDCRKIEEGILESEAAQATGILQLEMTGIVNKQPWTVYGSGGGKKVREGNPRG